MRFPKAAFGLTLLLAGLASAQAPGPANEVKQLEGRWVIVHRAYDPSPDTAEVARLLTDLGSHVQLKSGKLTSLDRKDYALDIQLRGGPAPQAVDLRGPGEDGRILQGIYRVDGDVLSLAVGTGKGRPRTFRIVPDQVLVILKRPRGG